MKNEIRKRILSERQALSADEVRERSEIICRKVIESAEYKNAESIMVYFPIKGEVQTDIIISDAIRAGKVIYAPRVCGCIIYPVKYEGADKMTRGRFGISEPSGEEFKGEIDLVIVPALAFDKNGVRLGFGKGYYDKFLKDKKCIRMGLAYGFQIVDELPADSHDIPMNLLIHD